MKQYNRHEGNLLQDPNGIWVKYTEAQSSIDAERTRADRAEARVRELEARIAELEKPKTCEGCAVVELDRLPNVDTRVCDRCQRAMLDRYDKRH